MAQAAPWDPRKHLVVLDDDDPFAGHYPFTDDPFATLPILPLDRLEAIASTASGKDDHDPEFAAALRTQLAFSYGQQDPEKGLDWLETIPEGERYSAGMGIFFSWRDRGKAARRAVAKLPPGQLQFALAVRAPQALTSAPEAAESLRQWVSALPPETQDAMLTETIFAASAEALGAIIEELPSKV
ncbi:MAG: hypothetical protein O3C21_10710, partial [Verrucomicrobia bacterium]|nr:hypothetical protein [Verrucomicrobiota bacterium]